MMTMLTDNIYGLTPWRYIVGQRVGALEPICWCFGDCWWTGRKNVHLYVSFFPFSCFAFPLFFTSGVGRYRFGVVIYCKIVALLSLVLAGMGSDNHRLSFSPLLCFLYSSFFFLLPPTPLPSLFQILNLS